MGVLLRKSMKTSFFKKVNQQIVSIQVIVITASSNKQNT
jgi:hypothetical protein